MPESIVIDKAILVGAFKNDLGWDSLKELFEEPFNFEKIKTKAKEIILIHSDNDPYIPVEQAEYLSGKLDAKLDVLPSQGHFNVGGHPKYIKFPYLLDIIKL